MPETSVEEVWQHAVSKFSPEQLYISAMAPTELTLFQGEVVDLAWEAGYSLYYSTAKEKPMREALKDGAEQVHGSKAAALLRYFLCPNSFDWLMFLLEKFQDHVVEFSTYDCEWGTLPGYNTVFWEVRKY